MRLVGVEQDLTLQAEDAEFGVLVLGVTDQHVSHLDRVASARLKRRAILKRENSPMLWHAVGSPAIIWEHRG